MQRTIATKKIISTVAGVLLTMLVVGTVFMASAKESPLCDGVDVVKSCRDEDGVEYSKYIYHEAEPEKKREIKHPAKPVKTRTVYHPAETGTRQVQTCIKTSIDYKSGTCALSQCRDGSYSGSTGRGTCSHHGGVASSGGPWYVYTTETYIVKAAWTETVIDAPAEEAWIEIVVDSPAKDAYIEKILAE